MGGKSKLVEDALRLVLAENAGPELTANGIRAYHGSPHKIDKFEWSPRTRGTGEGSQAFGDGLYFAGKEDIARWYRDKLSRGTFYEGNRISDMHPNDSDLAAAIHSIAPYIADGKDPAEAIAQQWRKWNGSYEAFLKRAEEHPEKAAKALDRAMSFKGVADELLKIDPAKFSKNPGHMYEVELAADPNRLLDWNEKIAAQSKDVQEAVMPFAEYRSNVMNRARRSTLDKGSDFMGRPFSEKKLQMLHEVQNPEDFTGENLYKQLQIHLGAINPKEKAAEASQYLVDQGLHGMKFLDASSRGTNILEPTNNFVIPEDKRVSIIRRYAEGGIVDEAMRAIDDDRDGYATKGRVAATAMEDALRIAREGLEGLAKERGVTPREVGEPFTTVLPRTPFEEWRYDFEPTHELLPPKKFDPTNLKPGDVMIPLVGDRTSTSRKITSIAGNPLERPVVTEGGPDYMRGPAQQGDQAAWASGSNVVKGLNDRIARAMKVSAEAGHKDPTPYGVYVAMGHDAGDFSAHAAEAVMSMLPHSKILKKDALEFDAMMREKDPTWPGILSPKAYDYVVNADAGEHRKTVLKAIDKANWTKRGFPDVSLARYATTTPELVTTPDEAAGYAVAKLTGQAPAGPATVPHRTYPVQMPGEYAGRLQEGLMRDDVFTNFSRGFDADPPASNYVMAKRRSFNMDPNAFQVLTAKDIDDLVAKTMRLTNNYADGGEVTDAVRIAKDVGGSAVFMTDAQGRQYDAQGNVVAPESPALAESTSAAQDIPEARDNSHTAPANYESEVKPAIDRVMTPMEVPTDKSPENSNLTGYEPDLVNTMKLATDIAMRGQPQPEEDTRGEANWGKAREKAITDFYGNTPGGANQALVNNALASVVTYPVEALHDIPYELGRTGDWGSAATEVGANAAFTAPGMMAAKAVAKPIWNAAKRFAGPIAGAMGLGAATMGSDAAEAGPARWFSKLEEVARALPMEKMTGQQALAMLRKAASPEELRYTGTEQLLSSTPQISKGQLVDHISKNRVKLKEITLGGENPTSLTEVNLKDIPEEIRAKHQPEIDAAYAVVRPLDAELTMLRKELPSANYDYDRFRSVSSAYSAAMSDYMRKMEAMKQEYVDSIGGLSKKTKYHGYSTQGGEGYRENLYQYERPNSYAAFLEKMKKDFADHVNAKFTENGMPEDERSNMLAAVTTNATPDMMARALGREKEYEAVAENQSYRSNHWDQPDVAFHTRGQSLYYDPPGSNRPYTVHNVDETQSDPGQAGRKTGFKDPEKYEQWRNEEKSIKDAIRDKRIALGQIGMRYEGQLGVAPLRGEAQQTYHTRLQEFMDADTDAIKLRAELENLRKKLIANQEAKPKSGNIPIMPFITSTEGWTDRAIKHELDKALDSGADYFSWSPGKVHADRYNLRKYISKIEVEPVQGWDHDGELTYTYRLSAYDKHGAPVIDDKKVSNAADAEEYVGKEMADKLFSGENADRLKAGSRSRVEGLDLETGGEGMIGYYDNVYLKRVQKVLEKATGMKVPIEEIEVQTADGPRKQLGIKLTDEMREKARFSDFARGGTVTGRANRDTSPAVSRALALTSEF